MADLPGSGDGQAPSLIISRRIQVFQGMRVLLDSDLAELYGVPTKALVQAMKRNRQRFPIDFMFQLTPAEFSALRSQTVTSKLPARGGRRTPPFAFTEQGVAMLSSVLNSDRAIAVNIEIMRTFVQIRRDAVSQSDLAHRIADLEHRTEALATHQKHFSEDTRERLGQVFEALRQLMATPEPPPKRPIGFVPADDPGQR